MARIGDRDGLPEQLDAVALAAGEGRERSIAELQVGRVDDLEGGLGPPREQVRGPEKAYAAPAATPAASSSTTARRSHRIASIVGSAPRVRPDTDG